MIRQTSDQPGSLQQVKALRDLADDPLTQDIRRQYLAEYARHWHAFLQDISVVTGTSIGFDLTVLRTLAAPDSPLARLARAAARETTLSRPLLVAPESEQGLLQKVQVPLDGTIRAMARGLGVLPQERLERELVDQHFAGLREVVTGEPDVAPRGQSGVAAKPALEKVAALINQFYNVMAAADAAIAVRSLPPAGTDAATLLRLEASKLPAPFSMVLSALADSGTDKIAEGTAAILRVQARAQFDQIKGMLAQQVGDACKRSVEGRYPFSRSAQEVHIDEFTRIFSAGGAADDFFAKQLVPFVDTSTRPWRYKDVTTASLLSPLELMAARMRTDSAGAVATTADAAGPTLLGELLEMLRKDGPDPEAFARMRAIRSAFFREPGGKQLAWKLDMKIVEVDPSIVELAIDIDGQSQRYVHGPLQAQSVSWPGPRGGSMAQVVAVPGSRSATASVSASGPWALFRLLEQARLVDSAIPGRVTAEFDFDGRRVVLELSSGDLPMPLNTDLLRGFSCPGSV